MEEYQGYQWSWDLLEKETDRLKLIAKGAKQYLFISMAAFVIIVTGMGIAAALILPSLAVDFFTIVFVFIGCYLYDKKVFTPLKGVLDRVNKRAEYLLKVRQRLEEHDRALRRSSQSDS